MKDERRIQSYSIEFELNNDYDEVVKQFKRVYRTAKYQHDNNYKDTNIVMCVSQNDGFMSKQVTVKTGKRGRPKKVFVRDEDNLWYKSSIPHETHPHIHFLAIGKHSRTLVEKICHNENRKAKRCVAKLYSNKGFTPIEYIKKQASIYRQIGNIDDYL